MQEGATGARGPDEMSANTCAGETYTLPLRWLHGRLVLELGQENRQAHRMTKNRGLQAKNGKEPPRPS